MKKLITVALGVVLSGGSYVALAQTSNPAQISADIATVSSYVSTIASIHASEAAASQTVRAQIGMLQTQVMQLAQMPTATDADRANLAAAVANLQNQVGVVAKVALTLQSIQTQESALLDAVTLKLQALAAEVNALPS